MSARRRSSTQDCQLTVERDFLARSPGDECPRAQGDGRAAWRDFVGSPAMCAAESGAFGRLSFRAGHTAPTDLAMMRRIDELHLKWPFSARGAWCSNSTRQATASTASACKG